MAHQVALEVILGRAQQSLLFCGCRMFSRAGWPPSQCGYLGLHIAIFWLCVDRLVISSLGSFFPGQSKVCFTMSWTF